MPRHLTTRKLVTVALLVAVMFIDILPINAQGSQPPGQANIRQYSVSNKGERRPIPDVIGNTPGILDGHGHRAWISLPYYGSTPPNPLKERTIGIDRVIGPDDRVYVNDTTQYP